MTARIYLPSRNAMQSGQSKSRWVLEFEPETRREVEPLMGWTSSADMNQQVKLTFASKEDAIAHAEKNGIAYRVEEPTKPVNRSSMSYSDNFKFNRVGQWMH